ncbi:MAG TPA: BrnT family toxin [Candidatus Angelobacter sp.]
MLDPNWANPTISFETAKLVFDDPNAVSVPDPFVDGGWKTLGLASDSVLLVVEHTGRRENGQAVRINGARRATPQERRFYEQRRK